MGGLKKLISIVIGFLIQKYNKSVIGRVAISPVNFQKLNGGNTL